MEQQLHNRATESKEPHCHGKSKLRHPSSNIHLPGVLELHPSAPGVLGCTPVASQSCSGCLGIGLGWVEFGGLEHCVHSGLAPDTLGSQMLVISDLYFGDHVYTVIYIIL